MKHPGLLLLLPLGLLRAQSPCAVTDDLGDVPAAAAVLSHGVSQSRAFERQTDRDFFVFAALPHTAYTVTATPVTGGGLLDAEIRVWRVDGTNLLAKATSSGTRTFAQHALASSPVLRTLYVDARPFAEYSQGTYTLVVSAVPPADADGDGLPDAWETANGTNPAVADAGEDPDADGHTSLQEFRAGTHAGSFASRLRMHGVAGQVVTWSTVPGNLYTVQAAPTPAGPWADIAVLPAAADPAVSTSLVDPAAGSASRRCYRVRVGP